jgi:hypothetical protein
MGKSFDAAIQNQHCLAYNAFIPYVFMLTIKKNLTHTNEGQRDKLGRFQKGGWRYFFNYLISRYNVVDMVHVNGSNLYSRQGTSFNTRLILISGRKSKPSGQLR